MTVAPAIRPAAKACRNPLSRLLTITAPLILALAIPASAPAQEHAHHQAKAQSLGAVHFPISCAAEAQPEFEQAVALLHHMMYQEARKAFAQVAEKHPGCAMAHWGVAMTHFQPLWHPQRDDDYQLGLEAVKKAKGLNPGSDRERVLIAAVEALYAAPEVADWWTRLQRWSTGMEQAYRAHPDDNEIAAFYALSQLAAAQVAEDRPARNEIAAELLAQIHARAATHPGAIHYTIHANDMDGRAGNSLDVVRSYVDVAPSVPHALHMPTHIFVRLGAWEDVIEWNLKSAEAALRFPAGDATSLHYPHALDYLMYAHLQRADDQKARAVLEDALAKERYQDEFASAFHMASIPARYAVERREWAEAAGLMPRTPESLAWDRYAWPEAITWFAKGLGAVASGDLAAAQKAEAKMQGLRSKAEAAGQKDFARYIEIDRLILSGWVAQGEGDSEKAFAQVSAAAELEGTIQKHPITPGALVPAYEALGDLLMKQGKHAEALGAYEASRQTWPGRFNTLLGAARAAREAGEYQKARAHYAELLDVVDGTATSRPAVKEAREFVARPAAGS